MFGKAALAVAGLLLSSLGAQGAWADNPTDFDVPTSQVTPQNSSELTLHVVRVRDRKTKQGDKTTAADFADFVTSFNSYLESSGAPQRVLLGEVTNWVNAPRKNACSLAVGKSIAAKKGWSSDPRVKVLTYQVGCANSVAGGQAEIGGTYLTVAGGTTYDTVAHEFLHTLGLGHSGSSGCIVGFTLSNEVCPYRSREGVKYLGTYSDVSDLAGGYARGSVDSPGRLQPSALTGVLNRVHLDTLGVPASNADIFLDISEVTESQEFRIPHRASDLSGRYLHVSDGETPLMVVSLSSGRDLDTPYRVRPDLRSPAPPPAPAEPQLLAHYPPPAHLLGDTALINAVPGTRIEMSGPGRFGSGLVSGIPYPLPRSGGGSPLTFTVLSLTPSEAVIRVGQPDPQAPVKVRTRATRSNDGASVKLSWRNRGVPVVGVTALWRNADQEVETLDVAVSPGETSVTVENLPLLSGRGGWRFYVRAAETAGALTSPVYVKSK